MNGKSPECCIHTLDMQISSKQVEQLVTEAKMTVIIIARESMVSETRLSSIKGYCGRVNIIQVGRVTCDRSKDDCHYHCWENTASETRLSSVKGMTDQALCFSHLLATSATSSESSPLDILQHNFRWCLAQPVFHFDQCNNERVVFSNVATSLWQYQQEYSTFYQV